MKSQHTEPKVLAPNQHVYNAVNSLLALIVVQVTIFVDRGECR